ARGRTVLFGGTVSCCGNDFADTWEWDGTEWRLALPAVSPPAHAYHALAYDAARGETVLFGGYAANSVVSDIWGWDGTTWTEPAPPSGPAARVAHAMAYDEARARIVLFGGTPFAASDIGSELWEWDGAAWERHGAPRRYEGAAMAYDSVRGETVLFGG